MTSRERIRSIIAGRPADRHGFWLGNPHPDSLPAFHRYFGTSSLEELHLRLGSDFRWITPQYMDTTYRHPEGRGIFDVWKRKKSLGEAGPLAEAESVSDIERYAWPDPAFLDFTECLAVLRDAGPVYRASGFWMPFFHDVMDLYGVEEFLVKLHTRPDLIHATFQRVCGFYLEANARFFSLAGDEVDAFFFGNDFGTQRDLLIAPGAVRRVHSPLDQAVCRAGTGAQAAGDPPLVRVDPQDHRPPDRCRCRVSPSVAGPGRRHGCRVARGQLRRQGCVPGWGGYAGPSGARDSGGHRLGNPAAQECVRAPVDREPQP